MKFKIAPEFDNNIIGIGAENKINIYKLDDGVIENYSILGSITEFEVYNEFKRRLKNIITKDSIILIDKHPGYLVSNYIKEKYHNNRIYTIQHHFAHAAVPYVESDKKSMITAVFDGTGYGLDETVWGGEFIFCTDNEFRRIGTIERKTFIGGDNAVKTPYLMTLSFLKDIDKGLREYALKNLIKCISYEKATSIFKTIKESKSFIYTSSMGRFFDTVSVLCGFSKKSIEYEGEPSVYLNKLADKCTLKLKPYRYSIENLDGIYTIMIDSIIEGIIKDLMEGKPFEEVALRFHNTVIEASKEMFNILSQEYNCSDFGLSGGVFQNNILIKELSKIAFISKKIVCTDDSLGLGQIMYFLLQNGIKIQGIKLF